jgi:AraC family transcriptional regulator
MNTPRIQTLTPKKLIGQHITMSHSDNRTFELWHNFMPRRREIKNNIGTELFSIEVYPPQFFNNFSLKAEFQKWAAIEVIDFDAVPAGMETLTIPAGLYAVFLHKGPATAAPETYNYIFATWLPDAGFLPDNRPHFAVMGEKYKHDDPASEEEIWIPVREKQHKSVRL